MAQDTDHNIIYERPTKTYTNITRDKINPQLSELVAVTSYQMSLLVGSNHDVR